MTKHRPPTLHRAQFKSGRTHDSSKRRTGGMRGAPRGLSPASYAVTRAGLVLKPSRYDARRRHAYVGAHKVCPRCLTRLIPKPERVCSFCKEASV